MYHVVVQREEASRWKMGPVRVAEFRILPSQTAVAAAVLEKAAQRGGGHAASHPSPK